MKIETITLIKTHGVERVEKVFSYCEEINIKQTRINIERMLDYWKDDSFTVIANSPKEGCLREKKLYQKLGNYYLYNK